MSNKYAVVRIHINEIISANNLIYLSLKIKFTLIYAHLHTEDVQHPFKKLDFFQSS